PLPGRDRGPLPRRAPARRPGAHAAPRARRAQAGDPRRRAPEALEMADFEYVVEYQNERGEWVEWHSFGRDNALAADRALERLQALQPARRLRIILRKVIGE